SALYKCKSIVSTHSSTNSLYAFLPLLSSYVLTKYFNLSTTPLTMEFCKLNLSVDVLMQERGCSKLDSLSTTQSLDSKNFLYLFICPLFLFTNSVKVNYLLIFK